jgi:hypothetical protein
MTDSWSAGRWSCRRSRSVEVVVKGLQSPRVRQESSIFTEELHNSVVFIQ